MQKSEKIVIKFKSLECSERGFEALCATQRSFDYMGDGKFEVSKYQKNSLEIQGIPHTVIS